MEKTKLIRLWIRYRLVFFLALFCTSGVGGKADDNARVFDIHFGNIEPPVVAQYDINIRIPKSNQQFEPRLLECSGIYWVDGYLVMSSDRHNHAIFTCPIDLDTMTIGEPKAHIIIRNEQQILQDAECITAKRRADGKPVVYVMCSLGNDPDGMPLQNRRYMLRFAINTFEPFVFERPVIFDAGRFREELNEHFKALGVDFYYTYTRRLEKNTYRWAHLEGITFMPDSSLMLCGMRTPLHQGKAFLFTIKGLDEAIDDNDPIHLQLIDLFALDFGNRGISDLCWDPVTKGYLIAAAKSNGPKLDNDSPYPPNTLDSALFWWSGRKEEEPVLFARVPDLKVEALCRLGTTSYIAIGSDERDLSEDREDIQQSVLTIINFTGIEQGR